MTTFDLLRELASSECRCLGQIVPGTYPCKHETATVAVVAIASLLLVDEFIAREAADDPAIVGPDTELGYLRMGVDLALNTAGLRTAAEREAARR